MNLWLILTALYVAACAAEYLWPGFLPFPVVGVVGLILIIGWAIIAGRDNRKVVGQGAYRTGQLD